MIEEAGFDKYDQIEKQFERMNSIKEMNKDLAKDILEKQKEIDDWKKALEVTQSEIDVILGSEEYQTVRELKGEIIRMNKESEEEEAKFRHDIAQIEKALKKYEHTAVENVDVIKAYLDSPVQALVAHPLSRQSIGGGKYRTNPFSSTYP